MAAEARDRDKNKYISGPSRPASSPVRRLSNMAVPMYGAEAVVVPPEATRAADITGSSSFP